MVQVRLFSILAISLLSFSSFAKEQLSSKARTPKASHYEERTFSANLEDFDCKFGECTSNTNFAVQSEKVIETVVFCNGRMTEAFGASGNEYWITPETKLVGGNVKVSLQIYKRSAKSQYDDESIKDLQASSNTISTTISCVVHILKF